MIYLISYVLRSFCPRINNKLWEAVVAECAGGPIGGVNR